MYAVIKAGGKQHKVKPGDVLEIELVHGGHEDAITFTPILVIDDDGGTHFGKDLGKAVVKAKLVGEHKGDKVKVLKYRPKTGYTRRQGHRQMYTLIEIEDISMGKRAPVRKAAKAEAEPVLPEESAASTESPPQPEAEAAGAVEDASDEA